MLSAILFYLYLISVRASDDSQQEKLCVLPAYPKHGTYELLEPSNLYNHEPGDRLPSYVLEVLCEEGYVKTNNLTQICLGGLKSDEEPAQCLPICSSTETPGIMSCGVGSDGDEAKCVMPVSVTAVSRTPDLIDSKCGKSLDLVQIVAGGHRASAFEAPWHAGIYTKTTRPYMQICGGSVVSTTVVISAAHCFWRPEDKQLPARHYAVSAGNLYRPWNNQHDKHSQYSDVSEIKIPPRFQGDATSFQDDIALVRLSTPFQVTQWVVPLCLDFDITAEQEQLEHGSLGKVAGWGLTGEDASPSQVLKVVEMPVVRIEDCIAASDPTFTRHITSDKICAGYTNGTSVCKGDSGGGLAFPKNIAGEARYFLRGVVSGAPGSEHRCNTLSWATFTRVYHHQAFIRDHLLPSLRVTQ